MESGTTYPPPPTPTSVVTPTDPAVVITSITLTHQNTFATSTTHRPKQTAVSHLKINHPLHQTAPPVVITSTSCTHTFLPVTSQPSVLNAVMSIRSWVSRSVRAAEMVEKRTSQDVGVTKETETDKCKTQGNGGENRKEQE